MAWFRRFADPIVLVDDRKLLTLRDAANYIAKLSETERDSPV